MNSTTLLNRRTGLRAIILTIALIFLISTTSAQKARVTGTVLDSASTEPLVGANIALLNTTIGTTTDVNGWFSLGPLDPGSHALRLTFVGYQPTEITLNLGSGDSVSVRVLLQPAHFEAPVVVVTGTRTVRSIADVPVRVEAIPEEEIEEKLLMTPSNVAMLLNESTGMRVQTTSAASNTANLRIQGLSGRYTQILNDGIPALGGLSAGFGLMQLVPLDLRQVEVLKGATSTLYGADAIAGVVNFLPKTPGEPPELSLLLNATTQKGFDAAGFYSTGFDRIGLSFLGSHNRQSRYDVDGDGFADVAEFTRSTVTPRLLHRFSDNLALRVSAGLLDESRIGGAMDGVPSDGSSSPYRETIGTNRLDASSQIDWEISHDQSLALKLAWLHSDRDGLYGSTIFKATQLVNFADLQYTLDASVHSFLAGAAYRVDDFEDGTPGLSARSYRYVVPSVFLQDEIRFSELFTAVLGGRIDFHNTFGTFLVPRFSLMFRPSSSVTLRLGGGTGYKAPTIFVEEAEEVGFRNVRPLMDVSAENAQSASLDLNWRGIAGSFTIDFNTALFLSRLDDSVIADEDSLDAGIVAFRNATGPTESIGTELSLRLTYGHFKAILGYTYLHATQEDNGISSEVAMNPRHSFGAIIVWEDHEQQFMIGLENYWTGPQRLERNPFRTESPSYWITGFLVQKGFGNFRLFINFENIFDTRQTRYDPLFVGDLAAGNIRTLPVYAPLEGRVINGGVRYVLR